MTVTTDYEKMLRSVAEEEPPPVGLLAASPYLGFSVRRHPETDEGKLPAMVAVLIHYVQELDRNLGGAGVHFDPTGTVETDRRLTIRLEMVAIGDFLGRIETITNKLHELAKQAKRELVTRQDADINAKIVAELGSLPREVAEHLEPVAV